MWNFNRVADGAPVPLMDLTAYLERVAATITRAQIESIAATPNSPHSVHSTATHTSSSTTTTTTTAAHSTHHTTTSSLTPNGYTPSYSLTPSNTTPLALTPNPATPYTPSPRPTASTYGTSPLPAYGEEIYDTPPDKVTPTGGAAGAPGSRKRSYSESSLTGSDSCPPKKYRQ